MDTQQTKISFIGAGNMAASLIGGLIQDGFPASRIMISDPDPKQRERILANYPVHSTQDNSVGVEFADTVVFCVKPQVMKQVVTGIAQTAAQTRPLFLSIAAGIRIEAISRWLGGEPAVIRAMPNTPAMVQSGAAALYANAQASDEQKEIAESILRAVGLALWVDEESQLDTVTALSGSGPAYVFLLMEALQRAATRLGLPEQTASLLTVQTAFGAAKIALESNETPAQLRRRVTSPGGTTERALAVLTEAGIEELIERAVTAAEQRARELAEQMGAE